MDNKSRKSSEYVAFNSVKLKINPSHTFISTSDLSYTYGDLIAFSEALFTRYAEKEQKSNSSRILVQADKSVRSAFLISACFLKQIPMVIVPVGIESFKLKRIIRDTNVIAGFNFEVDSIFGLDVTSIKVPDIVTAENHHYTYQLPTFDTEKLFAILFTSGTTSEAKAVPLKFRHILNAANNSTLNLPLNNDDEWLLNLPLHHIGGISVLIRSILAGSKVFLSQVSKQSDLKDIFLNRPSLTHASLVPTQLKRLLDDVNFKIGPHVKALLLGGGPIPVSTHRQALQKSIPVITSFGMTETAAQCIAVPLNSTYNTPEGTSGKPLGDLQISLRKDSTGQGDLLWIKGSQVFDGYLVENLNRESFDSDGWFNTGDYARIDENGFVFIDMRRSDRIVSGGENINPFYVEEVLESIEYIAEAGVFGIPDEEWGQLLCAAIVLKNDSKSVSMEVLRNSLKSILHNHMIPKKFILVDKLPRTASGKLIRSELTTLI